MKIKCNIYDPDSISEAIAKINAYKDKVNKKASIIVDRLSKLGEKVVDEHFIDSGETYNLSCKVNGNSSMIIATGENVIFLEFGTGNYTEDHTDEMETSGLPPIFGGSWSATEGSGVYATRGRWYYKGVRYVGTDPMRGFYFASKEIKEKALETAIKVFENGRY